MDFDYTPRQLEWRDRVRAFFNEHIFPNEKLFEEQAQFARDDGWQAVPLLEELKDKARAEGLWNMFMPPSSHDNEQCHGAGLNNLDYAPVAEQLGHVPWSSEVFNCSAPDTGNMEILHSYGTDEQKERWLKPLMAGKIRSSFLMTEPAVASSDATNIQTSIRRDGDHYVIDGHKWFSSGLGGPTTKIAIVMGKTDPDGPAYRQQSMVLVPTDTPGVKFVRNLPVFGFEFHHPHPEVLLDNVRVPVANMLLGEGRGFEIAQSRLGPGRIHHCMRTIGAAEAALHKMVARLHDRVTWGKRVAEHSVWEQRVAEARTNIEMCRLLVLKAARMMDTVGNKEARREIGMIKVAVPGMALKIIDDAIQAHGGGGLTNDFGLAHAYALARVLRIADGPDEVHNRQIAQLEYADYKAGLAFD